MSKKNKKTPSTRKKTDDSSPREKESNLITRDEVQKLIQEQVDISVNEALLSLNKKKNLIVNEDNFSGRIELKDYKFYNTEFQWILKEKYFFIKSASFDNRLFIRAVATKFLFENIDFSKSMFDSCYLKNCRFISCKFEGAKFINCNLSNSYFENCNFDYTTFEKSFIDEEIFECAPKNENLKYKFARSLRLNYVSIGDNSAVANAIKVELAATKKHLFDSWSSGDDWHQKKYGGLKKRTIQFGRWVRFSLLDFLWGNGESPWKLVRSNLLLFLFLTFWDMSESNHKYSITDFVNTFFVKVPSKYFGIVVDDLKYYPQYLDMSLILIRLISFGLFMSILIKKYNRR